MKHQMRVHSHARSDVIASRWDDGRSVGFWTFRCQSCGHEWETKALHTSSPFKGRPHSTFVWQLYARYWSAQGGGVKIKCPGCGSGGGKP